MKQIELSGTLHERGLPLNKNKFDKLILRSEMT